VSINYVTGDATDPQGEGLKIIAHVCNDKGGWGRGFVVALSRRCGTPEDNYRRWYKEGQWEYDSFGLGQMQLCSFGRADVLVANMIAQRGIRHDPTAPPAVDYSALSECLEELAKTADLMRATVHMPRIGCGLGGGDWGKVADLIAQTLVFHKVPVTVYDLPSDAQ